MHLQVAEERSNSSLKRSAELMEQGDFFAAEAELRRAAEAAPDAGVYNNLGVALARQGKLLEAIDVFGHALRLQPDLADAHRNLALAWSQRGRLAEAEQEFRETLRLTPDSVQAHHELANHLRAVGKLDEAVAHYHEALRLKPDRSETHHDLGLALAELKRAAEARRCYEEALRLNPDFPEAHNNLGVLLEERGSLSEAVTAYRESIRLRPGADDAHNNMGVALAAQRKYEEAVGAYRQALALNPLSALALNNLGNSLRHLGQVDEAISCLRQAIRLRPDYAEAYNNLGIALVQQGRDEEAMGYYNRALCLRPDYPEAHLNRSLNWLGRGDFEQGWTEYEWRWKGKDVNCRTFRQRRWDGGDLQGRTVLVYFEQGIGDTLQFIRYARLLKQRGATVLAEVQKPLMRLLGGCPGVDQLIATGETLPEFDLQIPLLSLPGAFQTTLTSIPANVPYLYPDVLLREHWKDRLKERTGFKIGIAWQGNPQYRGDRQRSIALRHFAALARAPGVQLVSLQKGYGAEQASQIADQFSVWELNPIDEEAGAFMDTAAIMKNLDLVITSDTAIPHLAGALGVPVWMALPFAADWRWLREGEECPWYPTLRLFRQRRPDDWQDVFERMAEALRREVAARQPQKTAIPAALKAQADAHQQSGVALAKQGQLEPAQRRFEQAIECRPDLAAAHHNLGVVLAQQKRLDAAIASFQKTLELEPGFVDAHGNLGLAYFEQGRAAEAVAQFGKALKLGPGSPETYNNLGAALLQQGRVAEAARSYRQALRLKPEYPEAHLNLARSLLLQGDFEQGWLEYEWRQRCRDAPARTFRKPRWSGKALAGRTILLYAEQGLGDTLQFIRYAPLVKQGGGAVVVECQPALLRILSRCPGIDELVGAGKPLPDFDVHASLLSLPSLFRTTLATIPSQSPYLFAEPRLIEQWQARFSQLSGFKVGVAWQGNPDFTGDRYRSIPLDQFEPLAELPGVQLINLQKGPAAAQLVALSERFKIVDYGPQVDLRQGAFMDAAAMMMNLDLVVACDTSVAHLAGALGVPVWVALPFAPDCRWLLDRHDSPWYPTMRLFRQTEPGNWGPVFKAMARRIQSDFLQNADGPASDRPRRPRTDSRRPPTAAPLELQNSSRAEGPAPQTRNAGQNGATSSQPSQTSGTSNAVAIAGARKQINLTCPINTLGYGVVGLNILKALSRSGCDVAYWGIGRIDAPPDARKLIEDAAARRANYNQRAPSIRISHQEDLHEHIGKPRAGFSIFELNRFRESELNGLRSQDLLFVASKWAKQVVEDNGVFADPDRVRVTPLGVDRTIFHEIGQRSSQPARATTIFINVGKWEVRKGHDLLLEAFNQAFLPEDDVELWMVCFNPVLNSDPQKLQAKNREWEKRYQNTELGSKVKMYPRLRDQAELAELIRSADCGVFPSRAEGWNLPALEVLSCGRQLIITNYSAHTEYCNPSNSLLIEIDALEDAVDGRWFFGQGQWAAFGDRQMEQLVAHMRHVHNSKQESGNVAVNDAGIETAKLFNWDSTARQMIRALESAV